MTKTRSKTSLPKNYLSQKYQKLTVEKIFNSIQQISHDLQTSLNQKEGLSEQKAPMEQKITSDIESFFSVKFPFLEETLGKSCSSEEILVAGFHELKSITDKAYNIVDQYKGNNNSVLLAYCSKIKELIAFVIVLVKEQSSKQPSDSQKKDSIKINTAIKTLNKIIEFVEEQFVYLQKAIDVCFYQVVIPRKIESTFAHWKAHTHYSIIDPSPIFFSSKSGIELCWIKDYSTGKESKGNILYAFNPKKPPPSTYTPAPKEFTNCIYVLDARDPKEVMKDGIYYIYQNGYNSHGHTIWSNMPCLAYEYMQQRADGRLYDPYGGWRLNKPWTDAERAMLADLAENGIATYIMKGAPLPKVLATIVSTYTCSKSGFFSIKKEDKEVVIKKDSTKLSPS